MAKPETMEQTPVQYAKNVVARWEDRVAAARQQLTDDLDGLAGAYGDLVAALEATLTDDEKVADIPPNYIRASETLVGDLLQIERASANPRKGLVLSSGRVEHGYWKIMLEIDSDLNIVTELLCGADFRVNLLHREPGQTPEVVQ